MARIYTSIRDVYKRRFFKNPPTETSNSHIIYYPKPINNDALIIIMYLQMLNTDEVLKDLEKDKVTTNITAFNDYVLDHVLRLVRDATARISLQKVWSFFFSQVSHNFPLPCFLSNPSLQEYTATEP